MRRIRNHATAQNKVALATCEIARQRTRNRNCSDTVEGCKFLFAPNGSFSAQVTDLMNTDQSSLTRRAILAGTAGLVAPAAALAMSDQQVLSEVGGTLNRTPSEIAAGVTPVNYAYAPGDVRRYGADPTGTSASDIAFTDALASNAYVIVPQGTYVFTGSITVSSGKKLIGQNATLSRSGSSTAPLLYLLGVSSQARGFQITTANGSPDGLVVLGNSSTTDDQNAWWWRFTDCNLFGRQNAAGDIGIYVPSGQVSYPNNANYFGLIQNVNISGFDVQLWLDNMANAHNISNVQFCAGKTVGLRLTGAYANNVSSLYFHVAAANGYTAIQLLNKTAGSIESIANSIIGWTAETGGSSDQSIFIDTNASGNNIIGYSNETDGWTINATAANLIALNGSIIDSAGITTNHGVMTASKATVYGRVPLSYGTSVSIDASQGASFQVNADDETGFTINAPTNLPTQPPYGQRIRITISNSSGGTLGSATWASIYRLAGPWVQPAAGNQRTVEFEFDGAVLHEMFRSAADVPN